MSEKQPTPTIQKSEIIHDTGPSLLTEEMVAMKSLRVDFADPNHEPLETVPLDSIPQLEPDSVGGGDTITYNIPPNARQIIENRYRN